MLLSNHPPKTDLKFEFLCCLNFLTSTDISVLKSDLIKLYPDQENSDDLLGLVRDWKTMKDTAAYLLPFVVAASLPLDAENDINLFVQKIDVFLNPQKNQSFDLISAAFFRAEKYLNSVVQFYPKSFIEGKFNQNSKDVILFLF